MDDLQIRILAEYHSGYKSSQDSCQAIHLDYSSLLACSRSLGVLHGCLDQTGKITLSETEILTDIYKLYYDQT